MKNGIKMMSDKKSMMFKKKNQRICFERDDWQKVWWLPFDVKN